MFVSALQTEIFDICYCWIVHLSFLTSHNLLFFTFCKTSKKTTFSVFLSLFLVKLSKSQSLKLNISRTAWPVLMILVSFCRILNGLSDEIDLFWRCSSPLNGMISWFSCLDSCAFQLSFFVDRFLVRFLSLAGVYLEFSNSLIKHMANRR